jgi:hypothetical protein
MFIWGKSRISGEANLYVNEWFFIIRYLLFPPMDEYERNIRQINYFYWLNERVSIKRRL